MKLILAGSFYLLAVFVVKFKETLHWV